MNGNSREKLDEDEQANFDEQEQEDTETEAPEAPAPRVANKGGEQEEEYTKIEESVLLWGRKCDDLDPPHAGNG